MTAAAAMLRMLDDSELRWMIADRGTSPTMRARCHDLLAEREAAAWVPDEALVAECLAELDAEVEL